MPSFRLIHRSMLNLSLILGAKRLVSLAVRNRFLDPQDLANALLKTLDKRQFQMASLMIQLGTLKGALGQCGPALHKIMEQNLSDEMALGLINGGVTVDYLEQDISPLQRALAMKKTTIMMALLNKNANTEIPYAGKTALHNAIYSGDPIAVAALVNAGANKEALHLGVTPIEHAVQKNQLAIANIIIQAGVVIDKVIIWLINSKKEDLAIHLLQLPQQRKAHWGAQALEFALTKANPAMRVALLQAGADIHQALTKALQQGRIDDALMLLETKRVPENFNQLLQQSIAVFSLGDLKKLLPYTSIHQIPLTTFMRPQLFSQAMIVAYLRNPVNFLLNQPRVSRIHKAALTILDMPHRIKEIERNKNIAAAANNESAQGDPEVKRAHHMFEQIVKPQFEKQFLSHGATKEACILNIEKHIRALILSAILKDAQENHKETVTQFCTVHWNALVAGEENAMKASLPLMNSNSAPHSAWRSYNPYARVMKIDDWPNLLIPPRGLAANTPIYATAAARAGAPLITNKMASDTLRERVAYYYLAVSDLTDGDNDTRSNRSMNFMLQLKEIRHAHGLDNPSCYPGHLTRISMMGYLHTVAGFKDDLASKLASFCRERVFAAFQARCRTLPTLQEKEALLHALAGLTEHTARDVLLHPERYSAKALEIRQQFIQRLDFKNAFLEELKKDPQIILTPQDDPYIDQYLVDICRKETGQVLSQYLRDTQDQPPSADDIQNLNTLDPQQHPQGAAIFSQLMPIILKHYSGFSRSVLKLRNLGEVLTVKIPILLQNKSQLTALLTEMLVGFDDENVNIDEVISEIRDALNQLAWFKQIPLLVVNPYIHQCQSLQNMIVNASGVIKLTLQQRMLNVQKKLGLFETNSKIVQTCFASFPAPADFLVELTIILGDFQCAQEKITLEKLAAQIAKMDEPYRHFMEGIDQQTVLKALMNKMEEALGGTAPALRFTTPLPAAALGTQNASIIEPRAPLPAPV